MGSWKSHLVGGVEEDRDDTISLLYSFYTRHDLGHYFWLIVQKSTFPDPLCARHYQAVSRMDSLKQDQYSTGQPFELVSLQSTAAMLSWSYSPWRNLWLASGSFIYPMLLNRFLRSEILKITAKLCGYLMCDHIKGLQERKQFSKTGLSLYSCHQCSSQGCQVTVN